MERYINLSRPGRGKGGRVELRARRGKGGQGKAGWGLGGVCGMWCVHVDYENGMK